MELTPANVIGGIIMASSLIGGIIAFDSRYTKQTEFVDTIEAVKVEFVSSVDDAKNAIIDEMRTEVVKNRSVMITSMQREADDLSYQMDQLEKNEKPVPRYMSDKYKQIVRQIEALEDDKDDTD